MTSRLGTLRSILKAAGLENTRMSFKYAVVFEKAPENWAAYVPDLPGCVSTGATLADTERNIREAIGGHLQALRDFGDPIPAPSTVAMDIEVISAA